MPPHDAEADHGPCAASTSTQSWERQRLALRVHAQVFAVSMVAIVLVNGALNAAAGLVGELSAWWSGLALVGWGLGVTMHWLVVRSARRR